MSFYPSLLSLHLRCTGFMHIKLLMMQPERQDVKIQEQVEKLCCLGGFLMQRNPMAIMANCESCR